MAPFLPAVAIVAVQQVLFPSTDGGGGYLWGLVLQGLTLGLLTSLVALGMALVYRANRIVNFAQGDLGLVPAALAIDLVLFSGLPYLAALGVGLVAALAVGAAVEVAVVRRFSRSGRLLLTVATIGLAQLLAFGSLMVPRLWGERPLATRLEVPWGWRIEVAPLVFDAAYPVAWVAAPAAVVAVAVFLRSTDVGVAVRAAADRADRAASLGIPVGRLHTVVWSGAAALSFLALFLQAGIVGVPLGSPVGLTVLLGALAALTLGRLTHLPAVVASAMALGLLEAHVRWRDELAVGPVHLDLGSDAVVAPVLAVVILVALVVRRRDVSRAAGDATSSWQAAPEVRPVPSEVARLGPVRCVRALGLAGGTVVLVALPVVLGPGDTLKAAAVVAFSLVILSVTVLTGWAGQVSLGQMGFVAVGAATGASMVHDLGWDLALALPVAGLAGAAVAVVVGLPALRLSGLYLAVTTLAFALATTRYLLDPRFFPWVPAGRVEVGPVLGAWHAEHPDDWYWLALGTFAVVVAGVVGVRHSRTGRVLVALRENERAAAAFGVPVVRAKLAAFALSGFVAAVAGVLLVAQQGRFTLGLFPEQDNLVVFTAAVVGGLGSVTGAVVGASFLVGGDWFLPDDWRLLASSIGVLAVLLVVPGGLGGALFRGRDLALGWLARRRGLVVPGLVADGPGRGRGPRSGAAAGAQPAEGTSGAGPAGVAGGAGTGGVGPAGGAGAVGLLVVRGVDVRYGGVQVLFGVDVEVGEGEIVALLGTNGAGKSTLLKAICGLAPASAGRVLHDGCDITGAPAHEVARRGVALVPGGQGTFPSLTVADNLRAAGWIDRRRGRSLGEGAEEVLGLFPELRSRLADPAADLSGGQQQMLALAMAFLTRPRLVLVDELSLGLAPVVVERLVDVVRRIRDRGATVVVVEQSVNVALELAERAYFMEKGEVRFHGPTTELLDRPDVLRSVFLEGAARRDGPVGGDRPAADAAGAAGGAGPWRAPVGAASAAGSSHGWRGGAGGSGPSGDAGSDRWPGSRHGSVTVVPAAVPALEVRHVDRAFGGVRALDDVSLAVAAGEIVGVVGPNGAGKTTLFDVVSGFLPAERGRVLLGGRDVTGLAAPGRARAGLGRSFQDARLFPAMTVDQCIAVALERWIEGGGPIRAALHLPAAFDAELAVLQRVDELVELFGLGADRAKPVHELSTGSRRIVDLACTVAHQPEVVLLDEPSSGIAQREAEALGPVIGRLRDELGVAVVLIEHDMPLVTGVADRLVALDQGRVVAAGPPADVLAHPHVVASYLGGGGAAAHRSGARAGTAGAGTGEQR